MTNGVEQSPSSRTCARWSGDRHDTWARSSAAIEYSIPSGCGFGSSAEKQLPSRCIGR
ncbi:MAG TPA: hypothetical protein VKA01_06730 [Vicinamibacteria bacterium]|nr:hypothetical protein [Vicinamibacteria bacterium]